jgi:hypothetical protein
VKQRSRARGLCRPRLRKLTASTIATASISTLTNSLTERATALGLVLHLHQRTPSGQLSLDAVGGHLQRFAQRNDVAALGHGHTQRNCPCPDAAP